VPHRESEADDVAVERDGAVHVARPVIDVIDAQEPHRSRLAAAEDPGLLRLELVFGQHALRAEIGEPLELGGDRR
jgi:hypothetical protein